MTDSLGCSAIDSVLIKENPVITLDAGQPDSLCFGDSTQLVAIASGGTAPFGFNWSPIGSLITPNDSVTLTNSLLTTEIFTVQLTDVEGCTATDSVEVWVNESIALTLAADTFLCYGDSTQLTSNVSGGSGLFEYQWAPSNLLVDATVANPSTLELTDTTTFTLTVTDSAGCTRVDSITINVNPELTVTPSIVGLACFADTIQLLATPLGGTGAVTYDWVPTFGLSDFTVADPQVFGLTQDTTYTVQVTDSRGCSAFDTIRIFLNEEIVVEAGLDTTICYGDSIQLNIDVSGGQQPYALYDWEPANLLVDATVEDPLTIALIDTARFIVEVFDNTGCSARDSVTVFVNPLLTVDAGVDSVVFCFGDSISVGSLSGANGGLPPFTYAWTPAMGVSDPNSPISSIKNIDTARWYVLTVQDSLQCIAVDSIFVKENPVLSVEAGLPDSLCYGDPTCPVATPTGGTSGYSFAWSSPTNLLTPNTDTTCTDSLFATETFFVTVTDTEQCTTTDSVEIWVNNAITLTVGASNTFVCFEDTVSFSSNVLGGSGGFTYDWDPAALLNDPTIPNPYSDSLLGTTVFSLLVTDGQGCTADASVEVEVNLEITAFANVDSGACFGGTTSLSGGATGGSGVYTYQWTPAIGLSSDTVPNPTVSGLTANQIYCLVVTDANSCTDTACVTVQVNDELSVNAGPNDSICYQGMTLLTGQVSGGAAPYDSIRWATASGSTFGLSTPNQLSTTLAGWTTTDTLVLTVIDNAGCPAEDSVIIQVNPEIEVNPGADTTFCYRDSLILGGSPTGAGGTGILTYLWTPTTAITGGGETTPNPIIYQLDDTLIYTVYVTDSLGCVDSARVSVQENPEIFVDAGPLDSLCFLGQTTLTGNVTGGGPFISQNPYQYSWNPSSLVVDPNALTTPTLPLDTSYQFFLTAVDSVGCQNTDSVLVVVNPVLIADADTNRLICYEETTILNGSVTGGTAGYTYTWFPSTGLDDTTSLTPICSGLQQTTTYTLVVTDAVGCTDTAQVTITVNPELIADAGGDGAICFAAPTSLSGSATGGDPAYSWNWTSLGSAVISPPNIPNPQIVGLTSTDTLILLVTDQQQCTDLDTLVIRVNPPISLQAFGDSVCYEDTATLVSIASGGTPFIVDSAYAFEWIPSGLLQDPYDSIATVIFPINTQTYQVFVTDAVGCQDSAEAVLTVNPPIIAAAGADQVLCFGDTLPIGGNPTASGGTPGYSYQWNPGTGLNDDTLPNPDVSNLNTSQVYIVQVTDSVGCTALDTTFIYANPFLTVDAGPNDSICYNTDALLNGIASGGTPPYAPTWTGGIAPTPANTLSTTDPNLLTTQTYFLNLTESDTLQPTESVR
ncbi:MAG: hypothetical protein AAFR59_01790, partial [Bacteroidota bacterium]